MLSLPLKARENWAPAASAAGASSSCMGKLIADRCKANGLKLSQKRQAMVEALEGLPGVFDVNEAWRECRLRRLRVALTTVYRLLADLVDSDVIVEVGRRDRRALFAVPRDMTIEFVDVGNSFPVTVRAPHLIELLIDAARSAGVASDGGRIIVSFSKD